MKKFILTITSIILLLSFSIQTLGETVATPSVATSSVVISPSTYVINFYLSEDNTSLENLLFQQKYDISNGMLRKWIKKYLEQGEESLENKRKPGNPLVKYCNKKNLSDMEKLEYENMKLRIENERLKKGYMMKGDGSFVMYKK